MLSPAQTNPSTVVSLLSGGCWTGNGVIGRCGATMTPSTVSTVKTRAYTEKLRVTWRRAGPAYSRKKTMYPSSSTTPTMFVMKGCSLHGVTNAYTAQHAREVGNLLPGGWSVQGGECKST